MAKDVPNRTGRMDVPIDYITTSYLLTLFRTDPRRICHYGLLRLFNAFDAPNWRISRPQYPAARFSNHRPEKPWINLRLLIDKPPTG
jgi:hypothetical protein